MERKTVLVSELTGNSYRNTYVVENPEEFKLVENDKITCTINKRRRSICFHLSKEDVTDTRIKHIHTFLNYCGCPCYVLSKWVLQNIVPRNQEMTLENFNHYAFRDCG